MYIFTGGKVNPLIGSAGVSAVPMAARVAQKVGQKENPSNFLLMHAMGPNVAGVIGSAVAAGVPHQHSLADYIYALKKPVYPFLDARAFLHEVGTVQKGRRRLAVSAKKRNESFLEKVLDKSVSMR